MEFSKEQIEKAKNCKTIEEFKSLAKAEGLNLTEEEAKKYFQATRVGELNDDELNAIAGGGKGGNQRPEPKFNINDRVEDIGKYAGKSKDFFRVGTVQEREFFDDRIEKINC